MTRIRAFWFATLPILAWVWVAPALAQPVTPVGPGWVEATPYRQGTDGNYYPVGTEGVILYGPRVYWDGRGFSKEDDLPTLHLPDYCCDHRRNPPPPDRVRGIRVRP